MKQSEGEKMEMEEKIRLEAEKKKKDLAEQEVSLHHSGDNNRLIYRVICVQTVDFFRNWKPK